MAASALIRYPSCCSAPAATGFMPATLRPAARPAARSPVVILVLPTPVSVPAMKKEWGSPLRLGSGVVATARCSVEPSAPVPAHCADGNGRLAASGKIVPGIGVHRAGKGPAADDFPAGRQSRLIPQRLIGGRHGAPSMRPGRTPASIGGGVQHALRRPLVHLPL